MSPPGEYEVIFRSFKHPTIYGGYQLEVDGKRTGEPYNGHPDANTPNGPVLGRVALSEGTHRFRFVFLSRPNPDMTEGQGRSLVVDSIVLRKW